MYPNDKAILTALHAQERSAPELCKLLTISIGTIYKRLKGLRQQGLVENSGSKLRLTGKGLYEIERLTR